MNHTLETIAEVAILAVIYYGFIRHLNATRGGGLLAGFIVLLLIAVAVFFVLLDQFEMPRLRWLASAALPVLGVALLVIFQPELRLAISRLGNIPAFRMIERFFGSKPPIQREKAIKAIGQACQSMSKKFTGALIVVERREGIDGFRAGGVRLNADITAQLLENIFYSGAPLHDGAVLIMSGRIMYAACHLPPPSGVNVGMSHDLGTRHRAAVGLSEQSDAMVVVVSEESGRISIAHRGKLRLGVTVEELEASIAKGINVQFEARESKQRLPQTAQAINTVEEEIDDVEIVDVDEASGATELSQ